MSSRVFTRRSAFPAIDVPAEFDLLLQPLEQRCLLSANFASVGLLYHLDGRGHLAAETFSTEGTITGAGAATGMMYQSGRAGRIFDEGLEYNRQIGLEDGRFVRRPDRGRLEQPTVTNGAQFLTGVGSPGVGWWYAQRRTSGTGGTELREEIEYIVERPAAASLADLQGTWRFSLIGVDFDEDEPFNGTGTLTIQNGTMTWRVDFGSVARSTSVIESVAQQGLFITAQQEYFYLSVDGNELIFADMADRDGIIFAGVAVRADATVSVQDMAGGYLLSWAAAGPPARDIRDNDIAFAERFLELRPNGDYFLYDLNRYDSGVRNPISRGTWTLSGSRLTLSVRGSQDLLNFTIADGGATILGTDWDDGRFVDAVVGMGVRVGGPELPDSTIAVPGVTALGIDAVYQLRGEQWFVSRVAQAAGAPAVAGELVAWEDPRDGRIYAAGASADGDLLLFTQNERGRWFFRNLSQELGRQENIIGDLSVMVSADRRVNIVGVGEGGQVVRFYQTGAVRPEGDGGGYAWQGMNISTEQLAPAGVQTPPFSGEIQTYATPWGGLNVVGLDDEGRLWSVWWSPGLERWQATDLTERYNAPLLAGGLTVFLTDWDAINIAGVDADGALRVTWWLPGFGDNWENDNLTAQTEGARLAPQQLASFVSDWGGLNIVGVNPDTQQLTVYWWSPERTQIGWAASSLNAVTQGAPAVLRGPLQGVAAPDDSLNVFAYNQQDQLVRLYWRPNFGEQWRFQNVAALAQELS